MHIVQGETWEETRERNGMNSEEFLEMESNVFHEIQKIKELDSKDTIYPQQPH